MFVVFAGMGAKISTKFPKEPGYFKILPQVFFQDVVLPDKHPVHEDADVETYQLHTIMNDEIVRQ